MEKKVCLITGANAGIGKAAALQIAQKGFRVIIGCRNNERGIAARDEIRKLSNNNDVELLLIDLSSQKSIKYAVEQIKNDFICLDVLIHNAAEFDISRKIPFYSDENIETIWACNHIGPVLLTNLLLEKLSLSKQGRIITIASQGLIIHPFLKINLEYPEFRKNKFTVEKAYYQSKLAQVMYTYRLAEQLKHTGITVNCIRVTNVKIDIQRYPGLSQMMKFLYSIKSSFSLSPDKMAETYTYLATSPDLNFVTGKYFDQKKRIVSSSAYSKDKNEIKALMNLTLNYLK